MPDKWDVLLPRTLDDSGPDSIRDIARFTSIAEYGPTPEELIPHIDGFEAIVLRRAEITREVIETADDLEVISKHGVGLDNVDIEAATEHDVVVCNTPGSNARAVAEHAVILMGAANRQLAAVDRDVRRGRWGAPERLPGEFEERTLGLFGCGDIGAAVAGIAHGGFEMEVLAYDPYLSADEMPDVVGKVGKTELFDRADVVSVHVPLNDETHHAIGTEEFERLAPGLLVNTARGPVVDEAALLEALDSDRVLAAGLDVFEREPPEEDNPLFDRDDVVLSSHIAGRTRESHRRSSLWACEHVKEVYEGRLPESTVNAEGLGRDVDR